MKILGREISGDGALRLIDMAENLLTVVKLSDMELGAELIDKVWADMPISSWESALVFEAIVRLQEVEDTNGKS
jgi:hypothetical protein